MRIERQDIPFTQVANIVLNDPRLTWKAKGVYAYMFGKPSAWDFASKRMTKDSKDGIDGTLSGMKELQKYGYLERFKKQDGKMGYRLLYHITTHAKPEREIPKQGNSQTGKSPVISNKEVLSNKDINNNKENSIAAAKATASSAPKPEPKIPPFDLKAEIKKLEEDKRRDLNIIALFLEEKKPDIQTQAQLNTLIRRNVRAAKELKDFTDVQIMKAVREAKREYAKIWQIETLVKILIK